jgi:invasion protein IalB
MNPLKSLKKLAFAALIAGASGTVAQAQTPPPATTPPPAAQDPSAQAPPTVAAWRLECIGDGKMLECQAMQSLVNRDDGKLVVLVSVRLPPKAQPTMMLQLPLGLSVAEPVQIAVDKGIADKQPVQTCTNAGCFVVMPLDDKFLLAMRTGTTLKVIVQDSTKRPISLDVPLLGFAIALEKGKPADAK